MGRGGEGEGEERREENGRGNSEEKNKAVEGAHDRVSWGQGLWVGMSYKGSASVHGSCPRALGSGLRHLLLVGPREGPLTSQAEALLQHQLWG